MRRRICVAALTFAAWTAATGQDTKIKPACELLTVEEVAAAARVGPVAIDSTASGEDDEGNTSCVWMPQQGEKVPVVILTVQNADVPSSAERLLGKPPAQGRVPAHFSALKVEAFGNGPPPAAVAGLGDEAFYRAFQNGKGGAMLVRRGALVVSFSGSARRETYVGLGKLVLRRL